MPLRSIAESELRKHCKRTMEGLELWLRRLLDDKLSAAFRSQISSEVSMGGDDMEYQSFEYFMKSAVLPHRFNNPTFVRLDGRTNGNLEVFGRFSHRGKLWKVNSDTHFEPLILAYDAIKSGEVLDPFIERPTKQGTCLVLVDDIRSKQKSKGKHLYVYNAE